VAAAPRGGSRRLVDAGAVRSAPRGGLYCRRYTLPFSTTVSGPSNR
jgi:hypothetical protein